MYGNNALGVPRAAGGVPFSGVYYDRASSFLPAPEAGLRAGVGGVAIGRAGWAAPDGSVLNARTNAEDQLGLVVIQGGDWRRVFYDETDGTWRIRQGLNMTMMSGAPGMLVQLAGPSYYRTRVYADPVDGQLVPGYAVGLEPTPWSVVTPSPGPGGLSLITTWNTPNG